MVLVYNLYAGWMACRDYDEVLDKYSVGRIL